MTAVFVNDSDVVVEIAFDEETRRVTATFEFASPVNDSFLTNALSDALQYADVEIWLLSEHRFRLISKVINRSSAAVEDDAAIARTRTTVEHFAAAVVGRLQDAVSSLDAALSASFTFRR